MLKDELYAWALKRMSSASRLQRECFSSARAGVHRERFARSAIGGVLSNRNIAIHIEQPPSFAYKLADFMQAVCAAASYLVARHEFHRRVIRPSLFMTSHFQPQPLAAWCNCQSKGIRTCAAMPRGQQIFFTAKGICGVARTHQ